MGLDADGLWTKWNFPTNYHAMGASFNIPTFVVKDTSDADT
jgi:hypothetical protein